MEERYAAERLQPDLAIDEDSWCNDDDDQGHADSDHDGDPCDDQETRDTSSSSASAVMVEEDDSIQRTSLLRLLSNT